MSPPKTPYEDMYKLRAYNQQFMVNTSYWPVVTHLQSRRSCELGMIAQDLLDIYQRLPTTSVGNGYGQKKRVVMRITDMITQDEFAEYFINFSPLLL